MWLQSYRHFSKQHADLFRFLFTEDALKIIKGLGLVSRPHFLYNFLMKNLFFNITESGQISLPDCVYFASYSIICVSCFLLRHMKRHDIWISEKSINSRLTKFGYLKNEKSFWSDIKTFSSFHKCSLLDIQNQLAKM